MRFRYTLSEIDKGAYLLPTDPVGWEDLETAVVRGLEYHGFFYEQTASLKFYCGNGREWIEEIYEQKGIEGVININIGISCDCGEEQPSAYSLDYSDDYANENIASCEYETFYEGVLDLQSLQFSNEYLEVSIKNDNFFTQIRNRLEVKANLNSDKSISNIDISKASINNMTLHSKSIKATNFGTNAETYTQCGTTALASDFTLRETNLLTLTGYVPYLNKASDDGQGYDVFVKPLIAYNGTKTWATEDCLVDPPIYNPNFENTFIYFNTLEERTLNFNINLSGFKRISIGQSLVVRYKFILRVTEPGLPPTITDYILYDSGDFVEPTTPGIFPNNFVDKPYSVTTSLSVLVPNNAIVQVLAFDTYANVTPEIDVVHTNYNECVNVESTYLTTFEETQCETYLIHNVANQICKFITDKENNVFRSDLLGLVSLGYVQDGEASKNAITNGYKIRGYEAPKLSPNPCETSENIEQIITKEVNISLSELFSFLNMSYNVGLGIEKYNDQYIVRIENKEYFYDKNSLLTFDWVADIKRTIAKELYYGYINIGYENYETEGQNGLDEFNTKREYNTKITNTDNNLTLLSKIISSGYIIEYTRRENIKFAATTDWKYDENIFVIATNRSNVSIAEKDENFSNISNLIEPNTSYNLRLSPTRALTRWMNVIASNIYRKTNDYVRFINGSFNTDLIATETTNTIGDYNNQPLSEKQDIQWDGDAYIEPIWIPEYYSFDYPLTFEQFKLIRDNAKRCIEFSTTDTNHIKGFIIECRYKPIKGLATFKLLKAWQ